MSDQSTVVAEAKQSKRWFRCLFITSVALALLAVALPSILARTSARDWLINRILAASKLSATTERASFGWFSPLSIEGLKIEGIEHRFRVDIKNVNAERAWPRLLLSSPELGTITIDKPHVWLTIPLGEKSTRSSNLSPTFTATINDAALTVNHIQSAEPIIDVDGVHLTLHVQESDQGLVLSVDPVDLFLREKITQQHCSSLLQLINPSLSESTQMEGSFSLSLGKTSIPIGVTNEELMKRVEVQGELDLHQVSLVTENALLEALAKIVADTRDKQPPAQTRVVKESAIKFQIRDGRLYHEGLRFGFPDIDRTLEIVSSGSVGLDQTLDVYLEIPRLDRDKHRERGPVKCHVTGTASSPQLSARDASLVVHLPGRAEPLIDVDGVDFTMRVEQSASGRVISFNPMKLLDREQLDRQLASSLLHLVEPDLQYSPQLAGEVSMSVDTLRIPVGLPDEEWLKALELDGKLVIHQATSLAQTPIRQVIVKLLCDLYGKEPVDVVRIAHDTDVDFELQEGRFYYEGLCIGFPDIDPTLEILSYGSVGLDETLDVHLEVPRLDRDKQQERGPVKCHVSGTVSKPQLSAKDASLVLRIAGNDQPILDVDGIDLNMQVEHEAEEPILVVAPVKVFDRKRLTPALSDELLKLIVPTLGDVADVQGEISLSLSAIKIPLTGPQQQILQGAGFSGQLQLHDITTTVETPLLTAMVKVLADQYGKQPSETIRVAKDAEINFELRDGRLFHDGLRLGFPDISSELVCRSSGSVGLDGSLDLVLDVPLILAAKSKREAGAIRFKVTGTVDDPTVVEMK